MLVTQLCDTCLEMHAMHGQHHTVLTAVSPPFAFLYGVIHDLQALTDLICEI